MNDETFSPEEMGMTHLRLDHAAVLEKFPEEVEAKCGECGASFVYQRHNGLSCPMCAASFEEVWFTKNKKIAFFEGEGLG